MEIRGVERVQCSVKLQNKKLADDPRYQWGLVDFATLLWQRFAGGPFISAYDKQDK